jgi:hypothetical protein
VYFTGEWNKLQAASIKPDKALGLRSSDNVMAKQCCSTLKLKQVKNKAIPLQAWIDPQGSSKLRFPDFMITAQDGGKVVSLTHRPPLPPGNTPGTHFC